MPARPLMWDDRAWKVVNVGNTMVSLLGEGGSLVELPQAAVESLVREGRIGPAGCRSRRDAARIPANCFARVRTI